MLKWFGAGVGCTTAVALGLYALNVESDTPRIPAAGSFALPLESEDPAPSLGAEQQNKTTRSIAQSARDSATGSRNLREVTALRATRPEGQVADRSSFSRRIVSNDTGWTLRFVPSTTEKLTAATNQPAVQHERTALAKRIQSELARAGCSKQIYSHGYWDKKSRAAAARFVRNRNSALPTNQPDDALYSMLRNYRGTQCGAAQIVRSRSRKPIRLQQPPRLAKRAGNHAIITGWSTRTSAAPPLEATDRRIISSNTVTPSSGQAALNTIIEPPRPSLQQRNSYTASGRMALGARPYARSGEPATSQQVAPLAVSPNNSFGPTDLNRGDNFVAPRYDAERSEALQRYAREAKRRARQAKARSRRAARRRYYRRRSRSNWRAKAFSTDN